MRPAGVAGNRLRRGGGRRAPHLLVHGACSASAKDPLRSGGGARPGRCLRGTSRRPAALIGGAGSRRRERALASSRHRPLQAPTGDPAPRIGTAAVDSGPGGLLQVSAGPVALPGAGAAASASPHGL